MQFQLKATVLAFALVGSVGCDSKKPEEGRTAAAAPAETKKQKG